VRQEISLSALEFDAEKEVNSMANNNINGNYAQVNGINLYYEIHGQGDPLILVHGGLGSIEMFGEVLPLLAAGRKVIGVDLQAHGRTADIERPMTFEAMADDIAALIRYLGFEKADVMGYSIGGGVAQQTVFRHPEVVRKLVVVSSPCKRAGWFPEIVQSMAQMDMAAAAEPMKQSPMYKMYAQIAPRIADWPVLLGKLSALLRMDYDWSEQVCSIKAPAMILVGDADSVRPAHALEVFEMLGGGLADAGWDGAGMSNSRLAILPATTHYTICYSPALAAAVIPFLDAPMPQVK
jgi:pimeloyl-ACP methyl ester carboxylesterase